MSARAVVVAFAVAAASIAAAAPDLDRIVNGLLVMLLICFGCAALAVTIVGRVMLTPEQRTRPFFWLSMILTTLGGPMIAGGLGKLTGSKSEVFFLSGNLLGCALVAGILCIGAKALD